MPNHKATKMLHPFGRGINNNLASLAYRPHIAAPKSFTGTFRTHADLVSKIHPVFNTDDWHRLSDGGSRISTVHRYLAVVDRARICCHPVGSAEPGYRQVSKKSIVLATELADGTWKLSIPIVGDADAELEELGDDGAPSTAA